MSYDRAIARVSKRDWADVRKAWAPSIGALSFSAPGVRPISALRDVGAVRATLSSAVGNLAEARCERFTFGSAQLHEAVFLIHKSANILVAAHDQVAGGLPTWSLATGYQAGLFAGEAITHLLGVTFLSYVREAYILDIFPPPEKGLSKKKLGQYELGSEFHVIKFADSVSHFHHWALLKRVLNNSENLNCDPEIISAILSLDEKDFARERNDLHYSNTWEYGDLSQYHQESTLFSFGSKDDLLERFSKTSRGFGIALGTLLLALAVVLLKDLSTISPVLADELDLLLNACTPARLKLRPVFEQALGSALV